MRRESSLPRRGAGLLEPALEALDPTAGVHELLLARVERVAVGADLDVELGLRRAGRELVAARARDVREDVLGMDVGLHRPARIAEAVSALTLPPETTETDVAALDLPGQHGARRRPRRRLGGELGARRRGTGTPPRISSSETRTTFDAERPQIAIGLSPANGADRPSAIECRRHPDRLAGGERRVQRRRPLRLDGDQPSPRT